MKTTLLCAALATAMLAGCVLPPPPPLVTVQSQPVVYEPGYVVTTLPTGYRTVTYHRNVYYTSGNVYYQRHPHGYVVVQRPY